MLAGKLVIWEFSLERIKTEHGGRKCDWWLAVLLRVRLASKSNSGVLLHG